MITYTEAFIGMCVFLILGAVMLAIGQRVYWATRAWLWRRRARRRG